MSFPCPDFTGSPGGPPFAFDDGYGYAMECTAIMAMRKVPKNSAMLQCAPPPSELSLRGHGILQQGEHGSKWSSCHGKMRQGIYNHIIIIYTVYINI